MLPENKLIPSTSNKMVVSSENLNIDNKILCAVKERKIKLWLLPFYNQETRTSQANVMTSYARFLAARLEMDLVNVYQALCKLQNETLNIENKSDLELKTEEKNPEIASKTVKRYTHSIHSARRQRA